MTTYISARILFQINRDCFKSSYANTSPYINVGGDSRDTAHTPTSASHTQTITMQHTPTQDYDDCRIVKLLLVYISGSNKCDHPTNVLVQLEHGTNLGLMCFSILSGANSLLVIDQSIVIHLHYKLIQMNCIPSKYSQINR